MRGISNVLAGILLCAITVAALAVTFNIVMSYVRSKEPRGEIINYYLTVEKQSSTTLVTIKATLFVSCNGPNCGQYRVSGIQLIGMSRTKWKTYTLGSLTSSYALREGLTKIDIIGYCPPSANIDEVTVKFQLQGPGTSEEVYKSVSIG